MPTLLASLERSFEERQVERRGRAGIAEKVRDHGAGSME
jgi:hypothetical protein